MLKYRPINPLLSANTPRQIHNRMVKPIDRIVHNYPYSKANELLTDHRNHVYELLITPPDSFGERVRSCPERGGSCFINANHSDSDQPISQAAYTMALLVIHYPVIYLAVYLTCQVNILNDVFITKNCILGGLKNDE